MAEANEDAPIPLVDLKANYQSIKPDIDAAVAEVRSGSTNFSCHEAAFSRVYTFVSL